MNDKRVLATLHFAQVRSLAERRDRGKRVPAAYPIGRSTLGTYGYSRTDLHRGSRAHTQANPLRKPT
jgi:hypothetical protein